jgi:hypothetical protein
MMATILFRCPTCHVYCIRRIARAEDAFALANRLPVLTTCWTCGSEALAAPMDNNVPAGGIVDSLSNHSQRIADACGRRADATPSIHAGDLFRRMQGYWRRLGYQIDNDRLVALVGAKVTCGTASPAPRLTAGNF